MKRQVVNPAGYSFILLALLAVPCRPAALGGEGPAGWLRPSKAGDPLVWGRTDGIVFGLPSPGGMPGPRGLVRVGIRREGEREADLINFIAFEPVVRGKRGFSELERSRLDGVQGKRLAIQGPVEGRLDTLPAAVAGGSAVTGAPTAGGAAAGGPEVKVLAVTVECEPFENGAHVLAELSVRSDRPGELRIKLSTAKDSAAVGEHTVTATMGNYGRLRRLALRERWVDSREVYKDYRGDGFAEGTAYPLEELLRSREGDAVAAMVTDEADPAAVKIERPRWWQYRSIPLTQYWLVPAADVRPDLRVRVNGRRVYWNSRLEIPGGIAFENFEMRQAFAPGQTFVFGLSRRGPGEIGMAPARAR